MSILDEIFTHKRQEVAERQRTRPLYAVRRDAETAEPALDFIGALQRTHSGWPALIAEVKHASPSRGVLVEPFDPLGLAKVYAASGASAISVLTDERYFCGSLGHLQAISRLGLDLPLLRKDFLCDPYQVYEARAAGADAVLLIAAHLDRPLLFDLHTLALELSMAALVEVHSRDELEQALEVEPALIGINNRNLRDFSVRLETTLQLRPLVPPEICLVAESGIHTPLDAAQLGDAGVDAILVGEALVTAPDVALKVRELSGQEERAL